MASPPRTRLERLKSTLAPLSSRTDTLLLRTSRLLTASNGIDNTLSTLLFTATLLHSQLIRILSHRYEKLALTLASKASQSMYPGETILATLSPPPPSRLSRTCAGFKALANTTGEVWMFLRLFGLFHIYTWARGIHSKQHRDAVVKTLLWAQIGCAATFQCMENVAYLASKGVVNGEKWEKRAPRWMALSNRFWMVQVLLEGLRLLRVRQLGWREELGAEEEEKKDGTTEVQVQSERLKRRWRQDFRANAAWLPLTLHWSYEDEANSPVPEVWQGICGLVPSLYGLRDAWRDTA